MPSAFLSPASISWQATRMAPPVMTCCREPPEGPELGVFDVSGQVKCRRSGATFMGRNASWAVPMAPMSAPWPWSSHAVAMVMVSSGFRMAQASEPSGPSRPQP
ncbi:MAG: hypothetical protein BWY88_00745 [Synergistetes bacterium ADurb.Bin520]|nr:MAG: hypothetical protein BWY88_00745 [Synergistetes bacterium ADurb.Bin520]